jgi:HEPN domain-containing protein
MESVSELVREFQKNSRQDFETATTFHKKKRYHKSLFFLRQSVEYALKAAVMKKLNTTHPPIVYTLADMAASGGFPVPPRLKKDLDTVSTFSLTDTDPEYWNFYLVWGKEDISRKYTMIVAEILRWVYQEIASLPMP